MARHCMPLAAIQPQTIGGGDTRGQLASTHAAAATATARYIAFEVYARLWLALLMRNAPSLQMMIRYARAGVRTAHGPI